MKTYENDELAYLRKVFGAASNLLFQKGRPQFMTGDAAEQELRDAVNEAQEFYDNRYAMNQQTGNVQELEEMQAALTAACTERDYAQQENKFLHDMLDAFEWQRINAMSVEEVRKELLAEGYTDERINAGLAKCMDAVKKALAKGHS